MMRYTGVALQFMAVLTVILGVLGGIVSLASDSYPTNGIIVLVSTLVGGVLLFGIGGAFRTLADIAVDIRRSAEANERTAEASARHAELLDRLSSQRTQATTPSPPDAVQHERQPKADAKLPPEKR